MCCLIQIGSSSRWTKQDLLENTQAASEYSYFRTDNLVSGLFIIICIIIKVFLEICDQFVLSSRCHVWLK